MMRFTALAILAFGAQFTVLTVPAASGQDVDDDISAFLEAEPDRRIDAADRILAARPEFEALQRRLIQGRAYKDDVPTGRVDGTRTNRDGTPHPYVLLVPKTYDPDRRYPLRILLHGGVSRPPYQTPGSWWRNYDRTASEDHLTLIPASWNTSKWWARSQSENLSALLADVQATYNIDENRVTMAGISDGGSGVYFHAARTTTPYAAFLPYIGHVAVVANPRMQADGEIFGRNFTNKPFYIVNTENDRLYPYQTVAPYVEEWRAAGADITFRAIEGAGHDLSWMQEEAPRIDDFLAATIRDPLPDTVVWETETTDRYNRAHWVEIVELGAVSGETQFPEIRGLPHRSSSGRILVVRNGNSVVVQTQGIVRYRLLLATTEFDFTQPIEVVTNGSSSFRGIVAPDPAVLLRRNAADHDRTMLFANEITIDVESVTTD
jgi:poly(3-hydroxybutyrate) depolymerase